MNQCTVAVLLCTDVMLVAIAIILQKRAKRVRKLCVGQEQTPDLL